MAYDALSLSVLTEEFATMLVGGKITKIYQPEKDEIILFVFNKQTYKLVISANAGVNRIHVTQYPTDNPKVAPSFCMLLRKFVTNATITNVQQMPYERVVDFSLQASDELGYKNAMHLIFELTGKTSNIILTDSDYLICDSIKHLPQDLESKRIIMAGAKYKFFPPQDKIVPFDLPRVREFLSNCATPLRQALVQNLLGVSQDTVNEILYNVDENLHTIINNDLVANRISMYKANLSRPKPCVIINNGTPTDVCPFDYQSKRGERTFFDSLNKAHDYYYYQLDKCQRFADKAKSVSTVVKNAISRTEKKLSAQRQSIYEASDKDKYKLFGDLILSNVWQIKPKQQSVTLSDYTTGESVAIPLDVQLTPQQNAQAYYKKYRKQKSAIQHNVQLVEENEKLLQYLLTIKQNLAFCTETEDLDQIRQELIDLQLIKDKQTKAKAKQEPAITPLKYNLHGFDVFVGKNNLQNNHVTFRLAHADDVWIHTHQIHSSHVVIVTNGRDVPDNVLQEACEICAYYSQASAGTKIAVDYTPKRFVKKPPHSALGFVTYDTYQTIIVNPNRHLENLI